MNTLSSGILFGISGGEWLRGLAVGAVVVLALWALREVLVRRLRTAEQTETWIDDLFLLLARKTSRVYMAAMGVAAAGLYVVGEAHLPQWLRFFTIVALCIQLLRWANAAIDFWLRRMSRASDEAQVGRASVDVIGILVRAAVFLVVFVLALDNFGVNVTALVTGLGITGIAVALAVQNILGDLLAALAITFDEPFRIGDEITVGDITGRVERVGLKTTRLRLGTGEEVSLANAEVMKNRLTNVSRTERKVLALTVGIPAAGVTGDALLALATRCEAAAAGVAQVAAAKARLHAIVDGRARITVECVLSAPGAAPTARPLLVAALNDVCAADGRLVLGIG
jgi:small-conductance mechanosensitive channel